MKQYSYATLFLLGSVVNLGCSSNHADAGATDATGSGGASAISSSVGGSNVTSIGGQSTTTDTSTSSAGGLTGVKSGSATGGSGGAGATGIGGASTSGSGGSGVTSSGGGTSVTGVGGTSATGSGGKSTTGGATSTTSTGGKSATGTGGKSTTSTGGKSTTSTGGKSTTGSGGTSTTGTGGSSTTGVAGATAAPTTGWLYTSGNHIYRSDGKVFHGRGANIPDTRSCWACAWNNPDAAEVIRRIDTLVDVWHANFIRLALESYGSNSDEAANGAIQLGTVLDDPNYLADIKRIVDHVGTKAGAVVLVSVWYDPTVSALGWPTAQTQEVWKRLTQTFKDSPHVMFGLVNEPQSNYDGAQDPACWQAMNDTVQAIRDEEARLGGNQHVITVQGTGGWARRLDYYVTHPIAAYDGKNIAYEVHVYDPQTDFDTLFANPAKTLPVVIGEFGPINSDGSLMTADDCSVMMTRAESLEVPYLAWTFHSKCPPNLLELNGSACSSGGALTPTAWGTQLMNQLAKSW